MHGFASPLGGLLEHFGRCSFGEATPLHGSFELPNDGGENGIDQFPLRDSFNLGELRQGLAFLEDDPGLPLGYLMTDMQQQTGQYHPLQKHGPGRLRQRSGSMS